jgi:hypothetical protein
MEYEIESERLFIIKMIDSGKINADEGLHCCKFCWRRMSRRPQMRSLRSGFTAGSSDGVYAAITDEPKLHRKSKLCREWADSEDT